MIGPGAGYDWPWSRVLLGLEQGVIGPGAGCYWAWSRV